MANRSLQQMMLEEQKRVTGGASARGSKPAGLLDLARPSASAASPSPTQPKPTITQPAPASPAMTLSRAAQTLAAPITRGSVAPAPAPASPAMTISKAAQTLAASPINRGYTAAAPAPQNPPSASSGGGVAGEIGKTALKVFSSGLGLMPAISGLAGLFGGGGQPATPLPLTKYAMPRSMQITAANSRDGATFRLADYSQQGTARSYSETSGGDSAVSGGSAPSWPAAGQSRGGSAAQVVVNVQAMDSRSFMDHSQEIAQAVRDAMLNMHSLNDVVSEL